MRRQTLDAVCVCCFEGTCFGCDIWERAVDPEGWEEYQNAVQSEEEPEEEDDGGDFDADDAGGTAGG